MTNPLSNLKIDYWYKGFIVGGAAFLLVALTVKLQIAPNVPVQIIGLGFMLWGFGEWVNHPLQTKIMAPNPYTLGPATISGYGRRPKFFGMLLDIFGIGLIGLGIYKILEYAY